MRIARAQRYVLVSAKAVRRVVLRLHLREPRVIITVGLADPSPIVSAERIDVHQRGRPGLHGFIEIARPGYIARIFLHVIPEAEHHQVEGVAACRKCRLVSPYARHGPVPVLEHHDGTR